MTTNTMQTNFRDAVAKLAHVARKHPETLGGQIAMAIITSVAFRVAVPIDLGDISVQFAHPDDAPTLDAALLVIRARARCEWPVDVVSDREIHGWLSAGKVSYAA